MLLTLFVLQFSHFYFCLEWFDVAVKSKTKINKNTCLTNATQRKTNKWMKTLPWRSTETHENRKENCNKFICKSGAKEKGRERETFVLTRPVTEVNRRYWEQFCLLVRDFLQKQWNKNKRGTFLQPTASCCRRKVCNKQFVSKA